MIAKTYNAENAENIKSKLLEMELACFSEPWTSFDITPYSVVVTEEYGFAFGVCVSGECELYRIAVLPEHRSRGLAYSLIRRFLSACKGRGGETVVLEVASRNSHAIALYEKCGFTEITRRPCYYRGDDAIVMWLKLD